MTVADEVLELAMLAGNVALRYDANDAAPWYVTVNDHTTKAETLAYAVYLEKAHLLGQHGYATAIPASVFPETV